jgi:hypothetical protein
MRRPQRVSRRARADQGERAHRRESPPRASSNTLDSTATVVLAQQRAPLRARRRRRRRDRRGFRPALDVVVVHGARRRVRWLGVVCGVPRAERQAPTRGGTRRAARATMATVTFASSSSSSSSLADVGRRASRELQRGHRLVRRRRELCDALERARSRAERDAIATCERDIARVDATVERVIERVEALKELARALEASERGERVDA